MRVEILDTNVGELADYGKVSEVGIAELMVGRYHPRAGGAPADRPARHAGRRQPVQPAGDRKKRAAANPEEGVLDDEEPSIVRTLSVPAERSFALGGFGCPSASPTRSIDAILGVPGADEGGVTASSAARLASLRARRWHRRTMAT